MQLIVNGSQTHVLEVAPEANVAQLRAQLSMLEGVDCEQVCPLQLIAQEFPYTRFIFS